jgi:hypothetical protein
MILLELDSAAGVNWRRHEMESCRSDHARDSLGLAGTGPGTLRLAAVGPTDALSAAMSRKILEKARARRQWEAVVTRSSPIAARGTAVSTIRDRPLAF